MKKIGIFLACLGICAGSAFPQTPSLAPKDARSMGMGGVFSAISSGYVSFYGNPAGFSQAGNLTLLDTATWVYFDPSPANLSKLQSMLETSGSDPLVRSTLTDYLASNGLGGGAAAGFGWTGGGVGLGAFLVNENQAFGETIGSTKLTSSTSANAVLGLGIPLVKSRYFSLSIGGDVRPFFRVDSKGSGWNLADIVDPILSGDRVDSALKAQSVTSGYGLAMDFGGLLSIGPLLFGVSVRDVSPSFLVADTTIGELLELRIPAGPYSPTAFTPRVTAGAGLTLKLIPNTIVANLYAEVSDPLSLIAGGKDLFSGIHTGMDLRFAEFLILRAGLNEGKASYGFGIDLALIEIDAALFSESSAVTPSGSRTGISIQAALRF